MWIRDSKGNIQTIMRWVPLSRDVDAKICVSDVLPDQDLPREFNRQV